MDTSKLGFLVSTVSRKRSNQTELRAYTGMTVGSILTGGGYSGNVGPSAQGRGIQGLDIPVGWAHLTPSRAV